jgi:anti-sigma28 factor (negative regulator of flagellin synthesis)
MRKPDGAEKGCSQMSDILPISGATSVGVALPVKESIPVNASGSSQPAVVDQVEISELAQMLSSLDDGHDIRTEKVAAIRESILNGTYETEDKLDYTINRLLEILTADIQ